MTSLCLSLVVTLHLAAVYLSMMGPLVCLWLQWRAGRDETASRLNRDLLRLASAMLIIAALLGGLAIVLIGRLFPDAYLAAARVLPEGRYWYGAIELVFSLVCFLLALAATGRDSPWQGHLGPDPRHGSRARCPCHSRGLRFWTGWLATLLGSTNLVYHFPTLFVMLGVLCLRPNDWGREMKFTTLLADGEVLARLVHHLLAALLFTGTWIAFRSVCGRIRDNSGHDAPSPPDFSRSRLRPVVWGGRMAVVAIVAQFLSGLWLVTSMPADSRELLLGADSLAAALFAVSLLVAFFVVPRLGAMALGHAECRHAQITLGLVLAVLFTMTAARHRTREIRLHYQKAKIENRSAADRVAHPEYQNS